MNRMGFITKFFAAYSVFVVFWCTEQASSSGEALSAIKQKIGTLRNPKPMDSLQARSPENLMNSGDSNHLLRNDEKLFHIDKPVHLALPNDEGGHQRSNNHPMLQKKDNTRKRQKRAGVRNLYKLWPNGRVYYEFDNSFSRDDKSKLEDAITDWQKYTCLTFIPNDTKKSRIQFKDGKKCTSFVGKLGRPQPIRLPKWCRNKADFLHQIGHAIGWFHEYTRFDRDKYVKINYKVVPKKYRPNFDKVSPLIMSNYGVNYDYTSIMNHAHNSPWPGAVTALDPNYQDTKDQGNGLSFRDIKLANIMYQCAKVARCKEKMCPCGGFQMFKAFRSAEMCACWCDSHNISDPLVPC